MENGGEVTESTEQKEQNIEYLLEFTEEKSAKSFDDRPQFKKLDKLLRAGDTVVFKDLSRFTREAENGYKKYMEWLDRDCSDDMNMVIKIITDCVLAERKVNG